MTRRYRNRKNRDACITHEYLDSCYNCKFTFHTRLSQKSMISISLSIAADKEYLPLIRHLKQMAEVKRLVPEWKGVTGN